ncbi:NACHT domain-containing protein [Azospirillum sp. TSO22-1]|uniref:NACHT domain-containing protein n=1 Tax=Azospirillum sp. TSO22-1 TaxID=716789 RepID=UPI001304DA91|nr:NACHT domain-containing protein [Azospirillum sp. TSO22-1]
MQHLTRNIQGYVAGMTGAQKVFCAALLFSMLVVGIMAIPAFDLPSRLLVGMTWFAILYITRWAWLPRHYGDQSLTRVALISIGGIAFVVLGASDVLTPVALGTAQRLLALYYPELAHVVPGSDALPDRITNIVILLITIGGFYLILSLRTGGHAVRPHPTPFEREFPEPDFRDRLNRFCKSLELDINDIDGRTNWVHHNFIPLEAEFELFADNRRRRRFGDLIALLRESRDVPLFLVLGDPGAGKSVALRKLCRVMLNDVEQTRRIPIYINLREWLTDKTWSASAPPTEDDLNSFITQRLRSRTGGPGARFIEDYFDRMRETGHLLFVFDSFDEIPAILDQDETSWIVQELASLIVRFAINVGPSRAIIASRYFRRPRIHAQTYVKLEVRPFTDERIKKLLTSFSNRSDQLLSELRTRRDDLSGVVRNPFTLMLLATYASAERKLPPSQSALYEHYVRTSIETSLKTLTQYRLTVEEIISFCTELAWIMFSKNLPALEISIGDIRRKYGSTHDVDGLLHVLTHSLVAKGGEFGSSHFTFSHRRFNEFFFVQKIIKTDHTVELEEIARNGKLRDSLILYAEVARENQARAIARFCFDTVKDTIISSDPQRRIRGIHCLRFIAEAFRTRRDAFNAEVSQFHLFLIWGIAGPFDILTKKLLVEAAGVTEREHLGQVLLAALDTSDSWIRETAFRSCRYVTSAGDNLRMAITEQAMSMPTTELIKEYMSMLQDAESSISLRQFGRDIKYLLAFRFSFLLAMGISFYNVIPALFATANSVANHLFSKYLGPVITADKNQLTQEFHLHEDYNEYIYDEKSTDDIIDAMEYRQSLNKSRTEIVEFYEIYFFSYAFSALVFYYIWRDIGMSEIIEWGWWNIWVSLLVFSVVCSASTVNRRDLCFYTIGAIKNAPKLQWSITSKIAIQIIALSFILMTQNKLTESFLYYAIKFVWSAIENYATIVTFVMFGIAAIIWLSLILKGTYILLQDRKKLKIAAGSWLCQGGEIWRTQLAECFNDFSTAEYRLKFVRFLADHGIRPLGDWPMGRLPGVEGDPATTELARLEEHWRGWDR